MMGSLPSSQTQPAAAPKNKQELYFSWMERLFVQWPNDRNGTVRVDDI